MLHSATIINHVNQDVQLNTIWRNYSAFDWTKDKCQKEAIKYKTRSEFQANSKDAYHTASANGWLNEICQHMLHFQYAIDITLNKVPDKYWFNKKNVLVAAQFCDSKTEFSLLYSRAYTNARRFGYIDAACQHMSSDARYIATYTISMIGIIAGDCKTRKEFKSRFPKAYFDAKFHKVLKNVCEHMPDSPVPRGYWLIKNHVLSAAKKCNSRAEFARTYGRAYELANQNGFLDEACSHMPIHSSKKYRIIYVIIFDTNVAYVGLTWNFDDRMKHHLGIHHNPSSHRTIRNYIDKHPHVNYKCHILTKPLLEKEASEREKYFIDEYKTKYQLLNKMSGGGLGKNHFWTKARIYAKVFISIDPKDFKNRFRNVYNAACRLKLLDDIYINFWPNYKKQGYYQKEKNVISIAKKYPNKTAFKKGSPAAYRSAINNDFKEAFLHMSSKSKASGYYNIKENVLRESAQCNNRSEFWKKHKGAAAAATRQGYYEEACQHIIPLCKPVRYWHNKQNVFAAVKKCETYTEFRERYRQAYVVALNKDWINEICQILEKNTYPYRHWQNKENVLIAASKCQTKTEFKTNFPQAHGSAIKNNWFVEATMHMKVIRKPKGYWQNSKNIQKAASECEDRKQFAIKYPYAYRCALKLDILKTCVYKVNEAY